MNFNNLERDILWKLWRNRCFGKGHMLINNVLRGFPRDRQKEFKNAIDSLIKKGILLKKPTKHGDAVYINAKLRIEIREILKKYHDFL